MILKIVFSLLILFTLSCSAEKPATADKQSQITEDKSAISETVKPSASEEAYLSKTRLKEDVATIDIKQNTPPEIKNVTLMPKELKHGDTLYVEVTGNDRDGDLVKIFSSGQ